MLKILINVALIILGYTWDWWTGELEVVYPDKM